MPLHYHQEIEIATRKTILLERENFLIHVNFIHISLYFGNKTHEEHRTKEKKNVSQEHFKSRRNRRFYYLSLKLIKYYNSKLTHSVQNSDGFTFLTPLRANMKTLFSGGT